MSVRIGTYTLRLVGPDLPALPANTQEWDDTNQRVHDEFARKLSTLVDEINARPSYISGPSHINLPEGFTVTLEDIP
jgi:hypothetical protein